MDPGSAASTQGGLIASLHVERLNDYLPQATEYLDLPPGYRFLIDGSNYEDVWFEASLLERNSSCTPGS